MKIVDDALASIDPDLAARYPGVALSRDSLLERRRQLIRSNPDIEFLSAPAATSVVSAALWWELVGIPSLPLALTVPALFATAAATGALHTRILHDAGVEVVQSPSSSEFTHAHLALQLSA